MDVFERLKRLWDLREVVYNLTARDLKVKYKNTWLGLLWILLNPLFTITILYFVFSNVIKVDIEKFPLFLTAGVIPWGFLASSLNEGVHSILAGENIALKVNIPIEVFPIVHTLSCLVDFMFALFVAVIVIILFGVNIAFSDIFFLPLVILFQSVFLLGLLFFLSSLQVFYRDVGHFVSVFLSFWFYLTPVFYSIEQVPDNLLVFYKYNPMLYFIGAYRNIIFYGNGLSPKDIYLLAFISAISFVAGYIYLAFKEKEIIKEL